MAKHGFSRRVFTTGALSLLTCIPGRTAARGETGSDAALLGRIAEGAWRFKLENDYALRLKYGETIVKLPDLTFAEVLREARFGEGIQEQLQRVDPAKLDHQDWLTYSVVRWQAEQSARQAEWFWYRFQVTPSGGGLTDLERIFSGYRFAEAGDAEGYLALLEQYGGLFAAVRANLAEQAAKGIVLPQASLKLATNYIRSFIVPPEEHPFQVAEARLAHLPKARRRALQAQVTQMIARRISPVCADLLAFVSGDYARRAPEAVGLIYYPGGEGAYRALVRYHTGLELSPEQIHRIGLGEVDRLEGRLAKVRRQVGFVGTRADFHRQLRKDPRFYAKTPEELGERLLLAVRAIEAQIPAYFEKFPKAPYAVKRLNLELEAGSTWGYYQDPTAADPKGYYLYNGAELDEKPTYGLASLIYHELIPGHHFQVCLQAENADIPLWRRDFTATAYTEGWAEYAASLAEQMGMYSDPYLLYGRLLDDLFMSARLVVDTGMNVLGWSRERASGYLEENSLLAPSEIRSETLRYAVGSPGQALAYKLGHLKIAQLQDLARMRLGAAFDIRRFHSAVLESGELPLATLERHIARFIDQETLLSPAGPTP
ncbi:MAG: DUF885 domain-containing protein [Aphanocapsa lilacina HA4352-LM1]|jgi:uncharacterized protein (DUF885 family)|nr:DUF885 domain-containing protein [Aphanocapsa lilacina HA4352-LM1]